MSHLGGDALHNRCADKVPHNGFTGFDAFINGKHFDAFQHRAGVLWEIKTDNFDMYTADLRTIVIGKQVAELRRERDLAMACGFEFRVGVGISASLQRRRGPPRDDLRAGKPGAHLLRRPGTM